MNKILFTQNDEAQIQRLAAQYVIYREAKFVIGAQIILAVVPSIAFAVLMIWFPTLKLYATLSALFITLLDFGLLDPLHKQKRITAARIQEAFDCEVLGLSWTTLRAGKQPPLETVVSYSRKINDEKKSKFRNWYSTKVQTIPDEYGRLICQRTNCSWDANLRRTYSNILFAFFSVSFFIVFILGLISNLSFEGFVLAILAPATPVLVLALRQKRENDSAAVNSEQMRLYIQDLWDKIRSARISKTQLMAESRALQSEIFLRRATTPPIFDWIYKWTRNKNEEESELTVEQLVKEIDLILRPQKNDV